MNSLKEQNFSTVIGISGMALQNVSADLINLNIAEMGDFPWKYDIYQKRDYGKSAISGTIFSFWTDNVNRVFSVPSMYF